MLENEEETTNPSQNEPATEEETKSHKRHKSRKNKKNSNEQPCQECENCDEGCECEECNCEECDCDDCKCEECEENCECEEKSEEETSEAEKSEENPSQSKEQEYLELAQRLKADFDNYRKRVAEQLDYQREEGKKSVIEVFLPCLDTFKEAKKSITDENVLNGIKMIEDKILSALSSLKVEKIDTIGKPFDHNLHEVIAVMHDEGKDDDIILDEFQAGYTFNGKVIRYSKVIVNKKGE